MGVRDRVWKWGQSLASKAGQAAYKRLDKARARATQRFIEPVQRRYNRRKESIKSILEEQGFVFPPNDGLPNPDWYKEPEPFIKRGLPWSTHLKVWRHAWGEYSKDFKKDILDQHKTVKEGGEAGQGEGNQRAQRGGEMEVPDERGLGERADEKVREFRQGVEGMRKAVGVDAKMDTKEDVLEALGQVRDSLGISRDNAKAAEEVKQIAKDRYAIIKDSTRAFLEGYRESMAEYESDKRKERERATRPEGMGGEEGDRGASHDKGSLGEEGRDRIRIPSDIFEWGEGVVGQGDFEPAGTRGPVGDLRRRRMRR